MTNTDHLLRNRFVSVAYLSAHRPVIFVKSLLSDDCAEIFCGGSGSEVWDQLRRIFREGMTFQLVARFVESRSLTAHLYKLAA